MQAPDTLPRSWQRVLALSGVAFAILFLVGWFASGADSPDYSAADQAWTTWADDNQWRSRIGAFSMLLAGFVFLHFAATFRGPLVLRGRTTCNLAGMRSRARSSWKRLTARGLGVQPEVDQRLTNGS
jgi:hypothetical protein